MCVFVRGFRFLQTSRSALTYSPNLAKASFGAGRCQKVPETCQNCQNVTETCPVGLTKADSPSGSC
eukprot:scaffold57511_cov68-Phaeocystis_antarctica.AAC.4